MVPIVTNVFRDETESGLESRFSESGDVSYTLIRDLLRLAHDSVAHQLNIGTVKTGVSTDSLLEINRV